MVVETFHILHKHCIWIDFVCIWQRLNEKQTDITKLNETNVENVYK